MSEEIPRTIGADLVYEAGRFRRGRVLRVDRDGRILAIEAGTKAELELGGQALIPGFVNGHSHAFQIELRGRTATRPADRASHFWSWREAMYRLVDAITPESLYQHSLRAFIEMASAGITTVGEFHYVHNDRGGRAYSEPDLLARRVIEAARAAGVRIVLLNVFYERAGMRDEPLSDAQKRFDGGDVDDFLRRTFELSNAYADDAMVSVGIAAHSLRGASANSIRRLAAGAREMSNAFHIHLSEQKREIEESEEVYGRRPIEVISDLDALGPGTTGVHCTHVSDSEIGLLARSGAIVCACPTTEADLGDGFLLANEMLGHGVPISLGSDSQVRIDPFEEMRALEYHERLRLERRNVLAEKMGDADVARPLIEMATLNGARSLGVEAGELAPGRWADMVAIDLAHPLLSGWSEESLAAMIALSADPRVVAGTYVGGRPVRPVSRNR